MMNRILPVLLAAAALAFAQPEREPEGWRIKPAGTQITVGTLPMTAKVTPDKKFLLVLNGGHDLPSVSVIDLATAKETSRVPVPDGWLGLTITKAGDRVYVGGGSKAAVYEFTLANGILKPARVFPVVAEKDRKPQDFIGDVQFAPDGHLLYAADLYRDSVVVINPQSGFILSRIKTGRRPYRILFHPSGKSLYVSSWADGSVGQYETSSGSQLSIMRIGAHTTDMAWVEGEVEDQPSITARLFVSASNTNNVYALGANENGDLRRLETINVSFTPRQPLGMTPSGLAVSADGKKLFVACSDVNAVAALDISNARSRVLGFIPTGWYPTTAFAIPDGRMGVLNAGGTVQLVDATDETQLTAWTAEVMANSPYNDAKLDDPGIPAGNPIKHVIYIVREGASRRATASIVSDYTQRMSGRQSIGDEEREPASLPPAGYLWTAAAHAGVSMRNYGFFVVNRPKADTDGTQISDVRDPVLGPVTDPNFRGPDPNYPDMERAKEFIDELSDFKKEGKMPQLLLVRMAGDDASLKMMKDAVSKSPFGKETAIFVVAPEGPANQLSALRTIEIILGLRPMTTFDAAAKPMLDLSEKAPK